MNIKTSDEIEKLKQSSKLADDCFEYIKTIIKVGMTEKEVANLMDEYMLSHGATKVSFDTIVGSGENSGQIHSLPSDRVIQNGDIVQLDFGCVLNDYCSDCSRVLFMGEVKEEYKKIYDIVLEAQLAGINNIKPSMSCKDADAVSRDIIKSYGYDFNHALGHGVGKEVHEPPVLAERNPDVFIENDCVFTIEPGIYFEGQFGIRIEDTCVMQNGKVIPLNNTSKEITIIL